MLNNFICGTSTFHQEEDGGPCSSPRKSKRKDHSRDNNPYSTRGLDKFSELLADLDQRRQKVYSQMSPQDISFVRFAYSSSNDFVPIVVKVKNNKDQKQHKSEEIKIRHLTSFSEPMDVEERKQQHKLESESDHKKTEKKKKNNNNFGFSWNKLKRPSFYVPAIMILILVFLIVFGRSVATLCTCVMWYIVPTLSGSSMKQRKGMMKKKDYGRGLSEKKMVVTTDGELSPRSVDSKSSGKHGHQKSW